MDSDDAEEVNVITERKYQKDAKVGEGTYAVVYKGKFFSFHFFHILFFLWGSHIDARSKSLLYNTTGRAVSSGRTVAIKKIKMGQFKDGLDLTAIREVKYLQELRHPNIIEVLLIAKELLF